MGWRPEYDRRPSSSSSDSFNWVRIAVTLVIIFVILAGLFFLFGYRTVDAGQVALRFGGGPLDGKNGQFKDVNPPGRHNMGLLDRVYPYPDTVRNYQFAPVVNNKLTGDAPSIPCVTKGAEGQVGPQIAMNGQFVFFLNTTESTKGETAPLGEFHKLYGVRYHAYEHFDDNVTDAGWPVMLNETFRPNAESVIVAACRNFTVDDLSKQESIDAFESAVGTAFTARIHDRMKGQFFCGAHDDCTTPIAFQMKPVLPPSQLADAATRLSVAEKNLQAAKKEAEGIAALREKGLTGMAAVAHECLQVPQCRDNMTFVGGDASVTVPAR